MKEIGYVPPSMGASRSHLDELLDQALEETFPASDPIAIAVDRAVGEARDEPETTIIHPSPGI
jgi:hypothetical protein